MNIGCVYHSIDLDGWMSMAIVKHWFNIQREKYVNSKVFKEVDVDLGTITSIGYNYGEPIPDLSKYDKIIMCDISFPKGEMEKLFNVLDVNLIWIDHHISTFKDVIGEEFLKDKVDLSTKYNGLRDLRFAACELTWSYFFPNETMPEIVRLLGMYDSFRHKNTDEETKVLEFQYGARQCISNYEDAYQILTSKYRKEQEENIWNIGKSVYLYLCTEAKQAYKNGFEIELIESYGNVGAKRKFICINKERFNPINFGIDYNKDGYDGVCCFHYDGKSNLWRFSLYNDNGEVDCSKIAKQYGGGGHFSASGMVVNTETMLKIING